MWKITCGLYSSERAWAIERREINRFPQVFRGILCGRRAEKKNALVFEYMTGSPMTSVIGCPYVPVY